MPNAKAAFGQRVSVAIKGLLDDGSVVIEVPKNKPLDFVLDTVNTIPGLANAIVGMNADETKKVSLPPKEAFGEIDPDDRVFVKNRDLGRDVKYKVGDRVILQDPESSEKPLMGWIEKLDRQGATITRSHPLAGKTIHLTVTLVSISE